jgi:ribose transport system substrate-binding protein
MVCKVITKQMPARGMMGVLTNVPTCGRGANSGDEALSPGQLAQVGGQQFLSIVQEWANEISERNKGPQKVIVVVGPDGNQQSENTINALENVAGDRADFEVVATVHTDYSTADALKKVQDALQANPDTTIIASNYSELTKGAVTALRQGGKDEDIRMYDIGADSTVIPLIKSGQVEMTYPLYPKSMGMMSIQALYDARMGEMTTRVFENDGHPVEDMRPEGDPVLFIDQDNVEEWEESGLAEY